MKHCIFLLWASIREVTQSFASSASVFLKQGHEALVCPPCCRGLGRLFFISRLRNHIFLTSQGVLKCDFGLIRDKTKGILSGRKDTFVRIICKMVMIFDDIFSLHNFQLIPDSTKIRGIFPKFRA